MEDKLSDVAAERLKRTVHHIVPKESSLIHSECNGNISVETLLESTRSSHHQGKEKLKWNGWGYEDTEFKLNSQGQIYLTGKRYNLSGVAFPKLRPWAESMFGLDMAVTSPANPNLPQITPPIRNEEFIKSVSGKGFNVSFQDKDRFHHSHGHTLEDVFIFRYGTFKRYVDAVIWPETQEHVELLVKMACANNVVIIPYGGGTSVTLGLQCPEFENRMIVSLDMHEMNQIKSIDFNSLTATIESGIIGKDLDEKLSKLGLCLGHEPDSSEFSSLGGWVATRASGMKKNVYGNIEDLLIKAKIVTPVGTLEKMPIAPRISAGPDVNHIILGSEGTLGVITEATLKLRPLPETRKFGSIIFPDFESGVACLREVSRQRCAPASIRLMDNMQFQFGQVLKPDSHSQWDEWLDSVKKWYVLNYKGFQVDKMVAATLLFEGNEVDVLQNEKKVFAIANKFGGMSGGEESGKRGYFLTYMIAYIRDFAFNYYFFAESFETSVNWANVLPVCIKTKQRIINACKEHGIQYPPFVSCRVTQSYDVGAAIYFYFGFIFKGLKNPLDVFNDIEHQAREEIMSLGGTVSHHHGIGKVRKDFMPKTVSSTGLDLMKSIKTSLDPNNIFASGNII